MPRFMLSDPLGTGYTLYSSDPELIGKWFAEMMEHFRPWITGGNSASNMFQLNIWPMWIPDDNNGHADWCADTRHDDCHFVTFDGSIDGLITSLETSKAIIEGKHLH